MILVTLDTVRADHIGCYGDRNVSTPNIDGLARVGVRFSHAYSAVPITLPSHTCIMTGSYPMATGMHDFSGNSLSPKIPTLATILRNHGYATGAFIAAAVLDPRFGLNQGFDVYQGHFKFSRLNQANLDQMARPGNEVMDGALAWLRSSAHPPFFIWVHLYDAHYPYKVPEPFESEYRTHPYDGGIAFDDAQVGRLLDYLRKHGLFDHSIIAITADHGEGLGQHGEATHGFFIYNSTLHVPLIIAAPGLKPRVVRQSASLVDVMPTILQILHITIPPTVQGRSLYGEMLGKSGGPPSVIYSETYLPLLHFGWSELRGLQENGWKYIDAPRPELYDIRTDPGETKNLAPTHRAMADTMRHRLYDVIRRFTPASHNAMAQKTMMDPEMAARLRSLGYVAISVGTVGEANGKSLADPKDRIQVYDLVDAAMTEGQHGHYQESLAKLSRAVTMAPHCLPIHYLKALDEYHVGNYEESLAEFQEVLKLDPTDALATYYMGLAEVELHNYDAAGQAFTRALKLDPTNYFADYNLGVVKIKQNDVNGAVELFQQAVKLNPDYADALEALGELDLYLKRIPEAIQALEHLVAVEPNSPKAHFELGRAYQAAGRTADAERQFALARQR